MKKGTIKFYNKTKGFGFIVPEEGGKDIFVHATALSEDVKEGDAVTYDEEMGKRGIQAKCVQLA